MFFGIMYCGLKIIIFYFIYLSRGLNFKGIIISLKLKENFMIHEVTSDILLIILCGSLLKKETHKNKIKNSKFTENNKNIFNYDLLSFLLVFFFFVFKVNL